MPHHFVCVEKFTLPYLLARRSGRVPVWLGRRGLAALGPDRAPRLCPTGAPVFVLLGAERCVRAVVKLARKKERKRTSQARAVGGSIEDR